MLKSFACIIDNKVWTWKKKFQKKMLFEIQGGEHLKYELIYQKLCEQKILAPIKNFFRFDEESKISCLLSALVLDNADLKNYEDIAIIGASACGSVKTNYNFFKDYLDNGRRLARGNLFIYTLPTSGLAECAIHFGIKGPILYFWKNNNFNEIFSLVYDFIKFKQSEKVLLILRMEKSVSGFLFEI